MALMVSVSGIRGVFGRDLTPENLTTYAAAFGTWTDGGTIVLGRDSRITGPICEAIISSVLQSVGCNVISVGMAPTPTIAMAVLKHKADAGIIISASHNPAEWNALKLLNEKSEFLDAEQGQTVIEIAESGDFNYKNYQGLGKLFIDDTILEEHIDEILNLPYIHPSQIKEQHFKVAVDPVNGAGCKAIPQMLKALGIDDVVTINDEPSGLFAHNPEPLPAHLEDLCDTVTEENCDLGISVDPDADRLALITNEGTPFGEEYTQAAAFDFMLNEKPGPCATNLSSSRVVEDIAKSHGNVCHRSAVGEINVVKKMQEVEAVIGGEGNGGVINPDLHYGRDALVGIAMILQHLTNRGLSLAEYRKTLPNYAIYKTKLALEDHDADTILQNAQEQYADYPQNTIDGIKIDFPKGWVHIRKSNTEPILRIYSEAETPFEAEELANSVKKTII